MDSDDAQRSFEIFLGDVEAALRRSLISLFGPDDGRDAASHALLYGWEHWDRVAGMANPAGYLYRVGQNWGRRRRGAPPVLPAPPQAREPWVEPALPHALARLSNKQRVAVVLRHGSDWSIQQIAEFMDVSEAAARKNIERGLTSLRKALEVNVES